MAKLLEGIKVIEMGTHVAVPKAARLMAEWGAEVIKVENPSGDPYRNTIPTFWGLPVEDGNAPIWENENSNKQDICLNLKNPDALDILHKLLEDADVFLCNTRPKSLEKMGLDYEALKQRYPRLICAYFSGFGEEGPDKDRPGFDVTAFWARCGALTEWPYAEHGPFKPTAGFGDGATGSMLLAGVLAALYRREKTGKGERVATSLYGTALWYNSTGVVRGQPQYQSKVPQSRIGQLPFSPLFRSKDGDWFMMSITRWPTEGDNVLKALGLDEYVGDPRLASSAIGREHSGEIIPILDARFAELSTEEIVAALSAVDANFSKLSNVYDLYEDEQAWANDYLYEQTMASGKKVVLPRTPVKFTEDSELPRNLAPMLGEHTAAILAGLGYSEEQIQAMEADKAVVCYRKGEVR